MLETSTIRPEDQGGADAEGDDVGANPLIPSIFKKPPPGVNHEPTTLTDRAALL